MSKLFELKKWHTVADAAKYLSISFDEAVTEADVYRLALEGQLRLSVNFVNHAEAYRGVFISWDESTFLLFPDDPYPQKLKALCEAIPEYERRAPVMCGSSIEDDRFVTVSKNVTNLSGVLDLPMIGAERLDIESRYQNLTGGPAVQSRGEGGAFVKGLDGITYQLQDAYRKEGYFPADRLPDDAVIVVRSESLHELFESGDSNVMNRASHDNVSDRLARMNQASFKFWGKADRNNRNTHPSNAEVAAWLAERDFSQSLAEKAASIIRPEWAPVGRKPEEW